MHPEKKITFCSHKHSFTPYPTLSPYSQMDRMTDRGTNTLWFKKKSYWVSLFYRNDSLTTVYFSWDPNFLILRISYLHCMDLQPYSHDRFSKISRLLCASRNLWIIVVFLQRTRKEKLPFILINTLLFHISLLALTDRWTECQTEERINPGWAG
jgi:hypothetical protein